MPHSRLASARLSHAGWGRRERDRSFPRLTLLCKRLLRKPIACGLPHCGSCTSDLATPPSSRSYVSTSSAPASALIEQETPSMCGSRTHRTSSRPRARSCYTSASGSRCAPTPSRSRQATCSGLARGPTATKWRRGLPQSMWAPATLSREVGAGTHRIRCSRTARLNDFTAVLPCSASLRILCASSMV